MEVASTSFFVAAGVKAGGTVYIRLAFPKGQNGDKLVCLYTYPGFAVLLPLDVSWKSRTSTCSSSSSTLSPTELGLTSKVLGGSEKSAEEESLWFLVTPLIESS